MVMLGKLLVAWALPSFALAGSAPGTGGAVSSSSLRGAENASRVASATATAVDSASNLVAPELDEAELSTAIRFLAYGLNPSSHKPTFLASTKPLFELGEGAVDVVNYLNLKSRIRTSRSTEEATREITAEMSISGSYGPAFSASVSASTSHMSTSSVQKVRTDAFIRAEKYVVTFMAALPHHSLLPDVKDFLMKETPARIVDVFGQFFASKLILGGVFRGSIVKEISSEEEAQSLSSSFKVNAGAVTAFSVHGSASIDIDSKLSSLFQDAAKEYAVLGGDINLWLELNENNAATIQSKWADSVTDESLAAVGFEGVQPIWNLLDHDDMNKTKAQGLRQYLLDRWAVEEKRVRDAEAQAIYRATTVTTTTTSMAPVFSGWFSLLNENSGKYLVVDCPWVWSCNDGSSVLQYRYNRWNANNGHWRLVHLGGGVHTLQNARGDFYLSIRNGDYNNGGRADVRYSSDWQADQWVISCPMGPDNKPCTLRNKRSGRYLSVNDASKEDGAEVIQLDDASVPESQWKIARV